jgi:hypothetical protein
MSNAQHTGNTRRFWPVVIAVAVMIAMLAALPLFAREFRQTDEDRTARDAIRTNGAGMQVSPRERYENFKLWQADHVDQEYHAEDDDFTLPWP